MAYGKSIELFLANGTADSLITAELSNWNGKAIKIPRIEVGSCDREDIKGAGVYFLFCQNSEDKDDVYIGESENVHERLCQHIRDFNADKEPYEWNTAVIFIGRDLNKALIRYLEHQLVCTARNVNRYNVLTKNSYSKTVMKESQVAAMDEFIDNIKILINALGYKVLEPLTNIQTKSDGSDADNILYLNVGSVEARGLITSEGFVLLAGSDVKNKASEKSISKSVMSLRNKCFESGIIKDLKTVEDIIISSSSYAAQFVLGNSVSGPKIWKNKDGLTLRELEEKEAENQPQMKDTLDKEQGSHTDLL